MGFYNAVVLNPEGKIIARTKLTTDKNLKWSWNATYGGDSIWDGVGNILADHTKPIIIMTRKLTPPLSNENKFIASIKTLTGKIVKVDACAEYSIADLKLQIKKLEGIPPEQQRIILASEKEGVAGMQLEDDRTLAEYGITAESQLHLVLRLRGGGDPFPSGVLSVNNLEGKCVTGSGVPVKSGNEWKAFGRGLNIVGRCNNPECKSTKAT